MTRSDRRVFERYDGSVVTIAAHDFRVLVVGLGVTGVATARYLAARGVDVTVIDSRAVPPGLADLRSSNPAIKVVTESEDPRWLEGIGQVVLSPGLALDSPIAEHAVRLGVPVVGDIELFARDVAVPVLAITGTNGKSTVVTLLERMLSATGLDVAAGGNIGPPALQLLEENAEIHILEVSSFQLETTQSLTPDAAVVLNVSPDHLDRHGTLAEYAALKAKLLQSAKCAVFNRDDPLVCAMVSGHPNAIPFSLLEETEGGYGVVEHKGERWLAHACEPLLPAATLRMPGIHNEANALAALALASVLDCDIEPQLTALREFTGLPHRCEWVAERDGVTFINDSKGTNVAASVAALEGIKGPYVLIAGGQGKGADFSPLVASARGKLLGVVVIGEAADELGALFTQTCPVRLAGDMDAAVNLAVELAPSGSPILLSPACASLDMFVDYTHRGDAFITSVKGLAP